VKELHCLRQVTQAPVTVLEGELPVWLEGTLARHACGVYGETGASAL
jgi:hypothetical protein